MSRTIQPIPGQELRGIQNVAEWKSDRQRKGGFGWKTTRSIGPPSEYCLFSWTCVHEELDFWFGHFPEIVGKVNKSI